MSATTPHHSFQSLLRLVRNGRYAAQWRVQTGAIEAGELA